MNAMNVGYSFDFAAPAVVPEEILPALDAHGIASRDVLLLVKTDYTPELHFGDGYLFFTGDSFHLLYGVSALTGGGRAFIEDRYSAYDRARLSDLKVADQNGVCMLTARIGGEKTLLCYASMALREDLRQFAKYGEELQSKGSFTPESEGRQARKDLYCPKCGLRYADSDAKICPKCMKRSGVVRRTFALFKEYRAKFIFVLVLLIVGAGLGVIAPYLSGDFLYEKVLSDAQSAYFGKLLFALIAIAATRLITTAINAFHGVLTARLAADMEYKLRYTIFSSIQRLSLSFFTSRKTGGLMNRVDNDAETIYWFFCDELPQFAVFAAQILAVTVIMFLINPLLALAAVIVLPPAAFLTVKFFKKMDILYGRRFVRRSSLFSALSDVLGGVRVVKAFSGEAHEKKRFEKKSVDLAETECGAAVYNAKAFPILTLIMRVGTVLVWAVGGVMILAEYNTPGIVGASNVLTYGMLATFLSYVSMIYEPLFALADSLSAAADSINAMGRLIEIMDAQPDVREKENALSPDRIEGTVAFRNVAFSYTPGVPVLEDITFEAKAGSVVGIVGRTGAGKSTLMHLLSRMYDPGAGEILIDGIDLRDLSFDFLRRNVAVVSQDTYLFSGSILDNVRYARPDATPGEVMDACVAAGANSFIMKLRDGYDTKIGQGNADLSGGEKQRLSIARAILKDPKILILDEATSAMDTRTEQTITRALEEFMKGRTTLMIAHRLSTLRCADELIVIDNKRVTERGTPEKLIKDKGLYYELYKLQVESMKIIGVAEDD